MQVRPAITSNARFHRDAWLEINLDHLESNLQTIYQQAKKPLILVLKADASTLSKAGVGLANLDNTTDLLKPLITT